ncbi:hypothetical protein [Mycolicibacterium chlorophenolicum]|uniref:Uncharacterized protein n=1 Tax=Mycolicibacterium chlorophenolicum TaxID=37916 RepID=A0A0J6WGU3_9MYCO|nr:hypothetical protein [Mycolicibacterium chlorophenolicum]KMO82465.1 hypothetical protein MCHLDSM_01088 [Mycolicibacterium chlorophenolicum]
MTVSKAAHTASVLLAMALAIAGCTPIVDGHAHRDRGFSVDSAIPGVLRPGNYPTTPSPPFGTADQEGRNGTVIEAQRLAGYVVGPWEVDPTLLHAVATETYALKNAKALSGLLPDPVQFLAERHHFVLGFSSDRTTSIESGGQATSGAKGLTNSVWEFASPEDARAAADDISQQPPPASLYPNGSVSPHSIPGYPQARARAGTLTDGTSTVESFTRHGNYLIYNYSRIQKGDSDEAAELIARILDLQLPRLDEFPATEPAQFGSLPVDSSGVLQRTLPVSRENLTIQNGVFEPRAALHFQGDPVASAKLFTDTGMQAQGVGDAAAVYQTPDAAAAKTLFDGLTRDITADADFIPFPPANGLPSTTVCSDKSKTDPLSLYQCLLTAGRYVAVVLATHPEELRQKSAAQYLMLTAP